MCFKGNDDIKPVVSGQAGSTVSTPHPGLISHRFPQMERGRNSVTFSVAEPVGAGVKVRLRLQLHLR